MLRAKVVGREVFDEADVLLAQCPNSEAAQYIAAALDLMTWVRAGLKRGETLGIGPVRGGVRVGAIADEFAVDGRALTLDAAVRKALQVNR